MGRKNQTEYIWKDKKRGIFGLPLSFTTYMLEDDKLLISTGFLSKREEEIRLYRIMDLTLKRSFGERLCGVGTIHCCSADKSTPEFDIKHIKNPREVKNLLSDMVEEERERKRIAGREFLADSLGDSFDGGAH